MSNSRNGIQAALSAELPEANNPLFFTNFLITKKWLRLRNGMAECGWRQSIVSQPQQEQSESTGCRRILEVIGSNASNSIVINLLLHSLRSKSMEKGEKSDYFFEYENGTGSFSFPFLLD